MLPLYGAELPADIIGWFICILSPSSLDDVDIFIKSDACILRDKWIMKDCRIGECRKWLFSRICHSEWVRLFVLLSNRISLLCEGNSRDSEGAACNVIDITVLFGSVSLLLLESRLSGRRRFCFQGNGNARLNWRWQWWSQVLNLLFFLYLKFHLSFLCAVLM